jgi:hypothetical protein
MFVKPWHTAQSFRSVLQQPRASGGDSDNWSGPSPDRSERLGQDTVPSSNYSAQSDCLRTHHPELLPDLPRLSFASAALVCERGSRLRARLSASIRTPSTFGSATNGRSTRPTKDHYENLYKALLPPPAVRCAAASQAAAPRCDVRPVRVKSVMLFCRHELPLAQTRRVQPDRANLEALDDLLLSLSYVSIRENLHCKIYFIKNSTTGLLQLRNL